jgi:hypothetical protein
MLARASVREMLLDDHPDPARPIPNPVVVEAVCGPAALLEVVVAWVVDGYCTS